MQEMTFEEWVSVNSDLLDEVRAELHPSGVSFGELESVGAEGAADYIDGSLRFAYDTQLEKDRSRLRAWNELVSVPQGA